MSDDARTTLAREQGDFLRRLTRSGRTGAPLYAALDSSRMKLAGEGLRHKRIASMLKAWPSLASLGDQLQPLLLRYFESAPSACSAGALGDAWDFVLEVRQAQQLPEAISHELVRRRLWMKRETNSIRPVRFFAVTFESAADASVIVGLRAGNHVRIVQLARPGRRPHRN